MPFFFSNRQSALELIEIDGLVLCKYLYKLSLTPVLFWLHLDATLCSTCPCSFAKSSLFKKNLFIIFVKISKWSKLIKIWEINLQPHWDFLNLMNFYLHWPNWQTKICYPFCLRLWWRRHFVEIVLLSIWVYLNFFLYICVTFLQSFVTETKNLLHLSKCFIQIHKFVY